MNLHEIKLQGNCYELDYGLYWDAINKVEVGVALIEPFEYSAIEKMIEDDPILFQEAFEANDFKEVKDYVEYLALTCFIYPQRYGIKIQ